MDGRALSAGIAALLAEARRLESAGRRGDALRALEAAPEPLRAYGSWHLARGAMLAREGRLDEAVAALREAVLRDDDVPEVLASLGGALIERSRRAGTGAGAAVAKAAGTASIADLAEAIRMLERAMALGPRLAPTWSSLGLAYHLAGRREDAVAILEAGLAAHPGDPALRKNLAAARASGAGAQPRA